MKRSNISDYLGKKLWNVTIIGLDPDYIGKTYNANKWLFQCDCGTIFSAAPSRVLSGHKKSCGCRNAKQRITHGCGNSEYYHGWWSMMQRCYNPNHHNFKRYGARGISVCEEWKDPSNFIAWAIQSNGEHRNGFTLDRIDNDGNYCPENCRWASPSTQSNNRKNTVKVFYNGEMVPIALVAKEHGLDANLVRARVFNLGWSIEEALSTPIRGASHKNPSESKEKRPQKCICINGEYKTVTEWCKEFGTSRDLAFQRRSRGWDIESAIKTPKKTEWVTGRGGKISKKQKIEAKSGEN